MATSSYFLKRAKKMQIAFFLVFVMALFFPYVVDAGIAEGCYCTEENAIGSTKYDSAIESNCASKSAPVYGTCVWYQKNGGFDPNKKNGCYCSQFGTEESEFDKSNVAGYASIVNESQCQASSKEIDDITGGLDYHYCTWYLDNTKKITWKAGEEINLNQKNGCYCNKNSQLSKTISDYEGCGIGAANASLGYDSCLWYEKDQLIKTFTKENVGKCIAVNEGDYCGQFDATNCAVQSAESPCILVNGKCELAVNPVFYCSKFPIVSCKAHQGLCAWQGAGTDLNKPVADPNAVQVGPKPDKTFDATVLNRLGTVDVKVYLARIIKASMGILGSISLVMFVYSGILFMTDRGGGENVGKAKEIAVWTTLGLALIFASYAILNFIFQIFGK